MNTIDLTPLYRSSVGFDRFGALLDSALRGEQKTAGYPHYDIQVIDENRYAVTLAVAGFDRAELDIQTEKNLLTVKGKKENVEDQDNYLYRGIANRSFERKFNLADHVEVTSADLKNGLLTIQLVKEIPEAMKPKSIAINESANALEHDKEKEKAA